MSIAEWREYETEQHGTDYAAAYVLAASQRDALRERLRDTAAVLDEFANAGISYDGNSRYDEIQVTKGLQGEAEAILKRLKEEGLM